MVYGSTWKNQRLILLFREEVLQGTCNKAEFKFHLDSILQVTLSKTSA